MGGWMGGAMSIGGRLIKIDSCLSKSVVYQMSMRLLHKTTIEEITKPIRAFFWAGDANKRKYHFVKWRWICKPKSKGGLGVKDLHKFNISLMCKWWWKLENEEGPWQQFMRRNYLGDAGIQWARHRSNDSPLWSDMLHVRDIYLCGRRMAVGNGCRTSFWKDVWCGHTPLMDKFPEIYEICNEQTISVADSAHIGWRLSFSRWRTEDLQMQWCGLVNILNQRNLSDDLDKPKWKWKNNRQYTVKSMYKPMCINGIDISFKHLWKIKIPLKIKIRLWLIWHNAIATKDNLLKRKWTGDPFCLFCSTHESILHLFFSCPAAQYVWSVVGMVVGATTRTGSFA
jgi:hypothetical protein